MKYFVNKLRITGATVIGNSSYLMSRALRMRIVAYGAATFTLSFKVSIASCRKLFGNASMPKMLSDLISDLIAKC